MPSRRALLATGGLAFASSLAGCAGSSQPPEPAFDAPTTAWPTAGYDPAGTGHAPSGPTDSELAWSRSRGALRPTPYRDLSTPVVAGGTVYVATLATGFARDDTVGVLVGVDTRTGKPTWSQSVAGGLTGGPAIVGDASSVVVGGRDGRLHAFETDGTQRWTVDVGGRVGTPTAYGDRVYVASENENVYAVGEDGSRLWTADRRGPLAVLLGPDTPIDTATPVADERGVYVLFSPLRGKRDEAVLLAYDHGGKRRWRKTLPTRYGRDVGGLAVTGDSLFATVGGTVFAVSPESGDRRWEFVTGADVAGPPSVDGERVYVGAKNLYALGRAEGTERWRVVNEAPVRHDRDPTSLPYLARPPVADGRVYLRGGAVDAADGTRQWGDDVDDWLREGDYYTEPYDDHPMAKPVVTEEAVYLTHAHHGVMKYR